MPDLVVAEHRQARVRAGELGTDLVGVGLVEDRAQQRQHPRLGALGHLGRQVAGGAAALPTRAGQGRADSLDQAGVAVGGDQPDAGKAVGEEAAQERQPAGAVLTAGHVQAQHLTLAVRVDPDCEQRVDQDGPAELADLDRQGVQSQERVRAGVGAAGSGNAATCASRLLAISLTCEVDSQVMPSVSTSFFTRRVDTPSR
jgi:hypothetical protein